MTPLNKNTKPALGMSMSIIPTNVIRGAWVIVHVVRGTKLIYGPTTAINIGIDRICHVHSFCEIEVYPRNENKTHIKKDWNDEFYFMFFGKKVEEANGNKRQRSDDSPDFDHFRNVSVQGPFAIGHIFIKHVKVHTGRFTISKLVKEQPFKEKDNSKKIEEWKDRFLNTRGNGGYYSSNKSKVGIKKSLKKNFRVWFCCFSHIRHNFYPCSYTYNSITNTRENKALRNYCQIIKEVL